MTEREVYKVLGWPEEGDGFILPVCDSEEDCVPYKCECGWRGIFYGTCREDNCMRCGKAVTILEETQ